MSASMAGENDEMCGSKRELAIPKQHREFELSQTEVICSVAENDVVVIKECNRFTVFRRFS
jgi:hypothetical protein